MKVPVKLLKALYKAGYNSMCVAVGLWLLTDQWSTFFGYMLIAEGFLFSIEHAGWRAPR